MGFSTDNEKRVEEGQNLTYQLQAEDGTQVEFTLTPRFVNLPSNNPHHKVGAVVNPENLPDGAEFNLDDTIKYFQKIGLVIVGGMNVAEVTFRGRIYQLFRVFSGDKTVAGSHGALYFEALPLQMGGGVHLGYDPNDDSIDFLESMEFTE